MLGLPAVAIGEVCAEADATGAFRYGRFRSVWCDRRRQIARVVRERKIEPAFLVARAERDLRRHLRRQRNRLDTGFEEGPVPRQYQRRRGELAGRTRLRVEDLLGDDAAPNLFGIARTKRPGEIIVDIHPESPGPRIRAFDVMPVVRRHEEGAAVLRVVIAVRARVVSRNRRRPVGAGSRLELGNLAVGRARKGERRCFLHEIARADAAFARRTLFDDGMNRAGVHRHQTHGFQIHAADTARALLVFEHVRVHRAGPRDRGQLRRHGRGENHGGHDRRKRLYFHGINASVAKARAGRMWRGPRAVEW